MLKVVIFGLVVTGSFCCLTLSYTSGLLLGQEPNVSADLSASRSATREQDSNFVSLFDGKSLNGWKITNFGGEGECDAEDGVLIVEMGYPMNGITYSGKPLPKTNYEISLEARRTDGEDFFCGLTFPVGESHCTFVAGGWGGCVTGLSCIDGKDASYNETRKVINYKTNKWYLIKVRVEPGQIQVWLDNEKIVDQDIKGRKISLRDEVYKCRPLGLCNFQTYSEFRNIRLKRLNSKHVGTVK